MCTLPVGVACLKLLSLNVDVYDFILEINLGLEKQCFPSIGILINLLYIFEQHLFGWIMVVH